MAQTQTEKKQMPATYDKSVTYTAMDGREITLSIDMVKKFLITPLDAADKVTIPEFAFFINICQARGLDPFVREVYPVKYGNDPLAIIVSIEFLRKRAYAEPDCDGWEQGPIVITGDKHLRYSNGIVLPAEVLIGGWFKGYRKGASRPMIHEVNLTGYLRYKKEYDGAGKVTGQTLTRFWAPENQPMMIAKVAEAQGLRRMWPGKLSKLYLQEEIGSPEKVEEIETTGLIDTMPGELTLSDRFGQFIAQKNLSPEQEQFMEPYLNFQLEKRKKADDKMTLDYIKEDALRSDKDFWKYFFLFIERQKTQKNGTPPKEQDLPLNKEKPNA